MTVDQGASVAVMEKKPSRPSKKVLPKRVLSFFAYREERGLILA
jgi:hypothetical protein